MKRSEMKAVLMHYFPGDANIEKAADALVELQRQLDPTVGVPIVDTDDLIRHREILGHKGAILVHVDPKFDLERPPDPSILPLKMIETYNDPIFLEESSPIFIPKRGKYKPGAKKRR